MEDEDACTFNSREEILTACAMSIHPSRMQHGPQRSSAQDHERWTLLPGLKKQPRMWSPDHLVRRATLGHQSISQQAMYDSRAGSG